MTCAGSAGPVTNPTSLVISNGYEDSFSFFRYVPRCFLGVGCISRAITRLLQSLTVVQHMSLQRQACDMECSIYFIY